jgi:hypothetical protein
LHQGWRFSTRKEENKSVKGKEWKDMKQGKWLWMMGVFLCSLATANATLQLSVSTDKSVYHIGETVKIFVSAYNPSSTAVKLTFGSGTLKATYLMDGTYNWARNKSDIDVIANLTIKPYETLTWQLDHNTSEQSYYPLTVGAHSVQGALLAWELGGQLSDLVEFRVTTPEPTTILLLGSGLLLLRKKKCTSIGK